MSFFAKKKKDKKCKESSDEFIINLSNIDISKIDKTFNVENIRDFDTKTMTFDSREHTSLEKLGISSIQKEPVKTILSNTKKKIHTYVSLIDIVSNKKLPEKTDIPCFGCHRKFSTQPIGIPIEFHSSYYKSANDPTKIKILTQTEKNNLPTSSIVNLDYFDTDGIVCSFNCIVSVLEDSPSPIYKKSNHLMYILYKILFGKYPAQKIIRSPSWKMRREYGGPLTDEEFEKSLQEIKFTDMHHKFGLLNPVGRIFEAIDCEGT